MKFEEDFPSLKDKGGNHGDFHGPENVYWESDIQQHCLDKQKVKDAIDDLSCAAAPYVCQCCENLEELKKDLGLQ